MSTRRKRVKHSHNKTRTTSKALLRKTRHKNKKNKQNKTKKIYQSGGGPKAKGRYGVPTEMKFLRLLLEEGKISQETFDKLVEQQKKDHTAEFDIDMKISGLSKNYSVKSANRNENQYSVTIMCGKSNRFITQTGTGTAPYHMIVVLREKHPTKQKKTQYRALEINLRSDNARTLLFGNANDCEIQEIVDEAQRLSDTYCKDDSVENHKEISRFNQNLKSRFGARIQLAPKKGNPEKKRATRAQSSFVLDLKCMGAVVEREFLLSSQSSVDEMETAKPTSGKSVKPPISKVPSSISKVPSSRRRVPGSGSRVPPQTEYFRKFPLSKRGSSRDAGHTGPAGPAPFSAIHPSGYARGFPNVYDEEDTNYLHPIYEGNLFPTSPAFNPEFMDE
jgi:hypothetical protein